MSTQNNPFKCEICGEQYTDTEKKWCNPCQKNNLKNNFTNWTSGNEEIDNLIQEMQLKIYYYSNVIIEWIPFTQLNDIKEIVKSGFVTHSAIWKDGPLYFDETEIKYVRKPIEKVFLKYSPNVITTESLRKVGRYLTELSGIDSCNGKLFGISQNPSTNDYVMVFSGGYCEKCGEEYTDVFNNWCKPCQINEKIFISENEKIDNFIKEKQSEIKSRTDMVFEWIPYYQFDNVKEMDKDEFNHFTIYSATWNGQLHYDDDKHEYVRKMSKVTLKFSNNFKLQDFDDEFLNEIKLYISDTSDDFPMYGISQKPDTMEYITVFPYIYCEKCNKQYDNVHGWCKLCQIDDIKKEFNWTSGNEQIDNLVREMQLKMKWPQNIVFEWIPYDRFNDFKEIRNGDIKLYSAIWRDGPLSYVNDERRYKRNQNKDVTLKWFHGSQDVTNEFLNEVREHSILAHKDKVIYGLSQNPDTKDYIMVLPDELCVKCGEKYTDKYYKWCEYIRRQNEGVNLKYLYNSHLQNIDDFLNEVKAYLTKCYGISQDPDTKDFILVVSGYSNTYCQKCGEKSENVFWCKSCHKNDLKNNFTKWTSGNDKIDKLIREMQLRIEHQFERLFKWIPYDQFDEIKEIGRGGFAMVYSAKWKNENNKQVALKCLFNSQNISEEFLNEVKAYAINKSPNTLGIYGISQEPDTKNYVMVLDYAKGGDFHCWIKNNFNSINWLYSLGTLLNIISGLKEIHQKNLVHRDFHTGNILLHFASLEVAYGNMYCISDMGLCKEPDNTDSTKIYGVLPFVAPEVLKGNPYTKAADIYSFGMIMYFVATGKQPFGNCAHDQYLTIRICSGDRPKINVPEAPKCYIDLMERCWNSNPDKRPHVDELENEIFKLRNSYNKSIFRSLQKEQEEYEIKKQFKEAQEYKKSRPMSFEDHPQAIYTSRLLNNYTQDLLKYENDYNNSVDITDFTV
ncbi:kinase-like domain-containing protein [Rhizophagus clarus]|uniref:Kinase-like domain-containing protein n=1 Tax=Rhizophagus clarus TaxID=94130 RepID=A0A8H3MJ60_9GLOM|nr:kinase-like domain-containing protein [Rhizophagus clarus]